MAYSLVDSSILNTSVDDSSDVDMLSDLPGTHQMDLLAQNFDNINMNSNSNARISYAGVVSSRIVIERSENSSNSPSEEDINKYLSFLLPFNSRIDVTKIPGCHRCLVDDSCNDPWCAFCTRGFCHRGALCKNLYSHFAMCGGEVNYCRDEWLRVRSLSKRREHNRISRQERCIADRRIRERVFVANHPEGSRYNPMEMWKLAVKVNKPEVEEKRTAVEVWKPKKVDKDKASPNCKCCEL